ncbi:MAG: beta-propeller fold lactonase family protein [Bryobacterales bacterium]|nr:beta-propeller fold lactonase family protein [Bryobacterales bacterium]
MSRWIIDGPGFQDWQARMMRMARLLPAACALALLAALAGAGGCGDDSVFPRASNTPTSTATPTPTATPTSTPDAGAFLYSGNHTAGTISEYDRSQTSGALSSIGTVSGGVANGPVGITTDPAGKFLYLANPGDGLHQFKINLSSGVLTPLTANNGLVKAGDEPQWVAFSSSGTKTFAYATNFDSASISQYVVQSNGELKSNGTATSGLLNQPFGAVATSRFLYVADNANGTMVSFPINSNGTLATGSASTTASSSQSVRNPVVVILDRTSSFVYVSDQTTGYISVFSTSSGALSSFIQSVQSTALGGAVGLALAQISSSTEFLYSANQSANSISLYIVNTSTGELTPAGLVFTGLSAPTGLAVGTSSSGTSYLYAAEQSGNDIVQFTINSINGSVSNPVTIASGSGPQFLALPSQ